MVVGVGSRTCNLFRPAARKFIYRHLVRNSIQLCNRAHRKVFLAIRQKKRPPFRRIFSTRDLMVDTTSQSAAWLETARFVQNTGDLVSNKKQAYSQMFSMAHLAIIILERCQDEMNFNELTDVMATKNASEWHLDVGQTFHLIVTRFNFYATPYSHSFCLIVWLVILPLQGSHPTHLLPLCAKGFSYRSRRSSVLLALL